MSFKAPKELYRDENVVVTENEIVVIGTLNMHELCYALKKAGLASLIDITGWDKFVEGYCGTLEVGDTIKYKGVEYVVLSDPRENHLPPSTSPSFRRKRHNEN